MPDQLRYVRPFEAPLKNASGQTISYLLWGDPVIVRESNPPDADVLEVSARGWDRAFLLKNQLMDEKLLEVNVIDVGQGDGILFSTPDNKFHMVDAGINTENQMTGKGAVNFVRWKFIEELKRDKAEIENLILSHPDLDHYGGMINLIKGTGGYFSSFRH